VRRPCAAGGPAGLGKTRLVDTLSTVMGLKGNRIQFTPDLMPADILGSEVLETAPMAAAPSASSKGRSSASF
jgi:MoxR-like ATPase